MAELMVDGYHKENQLSSMILGFSGLNDERMVVPFPKVINTGGKERVGFGTASRSVGRKIEGE